MNKKSFFIICSTLIIASNLLMLSVVNKGEETGEQSVCDCYSLCFTTSLFICGWKSTDSIGKSRINTPDSVDSYIPTPSYQQNREYAWNPQHYHYPYRFGKWDSCYSCCNHENIWEQTEVRLNSFRCIFTLLNFPRASMFFMLAFFIFNNSRCFDDHLWFGWKI